MPETTQRTASELTFSERHVPRPQGRIYVRDYAGEGPAFVLMHGLPDNLRIYDGLIPHLVSAGRRVVAFDFLGFGASDKPEGASYGFAQQRGDLLAVVDALGLERIVPVAHDSSGPAAVNFAIDHPERTHSVCILNSVYAEVPSLRMPEMIDLFAEAKYRALAEAFARSPASFAWLLDFQMKAFQAPLPDDNRAAYTQALAPIIGDNFGQNPGAGPAMAQMASELYAEMARDTERLSALEALDIPFRIVWGELDPYINAEVAKGLLSHLKNGSLRLLPAGHWLQLEDPRTVAEAMLLGT